MARMAAAARLVTPSLVYTRSMWLPTVFALTGELAAFEREQAVAQRPGSAPAAGSWRAPASNRSRQRSEQNQ